MKRRPSQRLLFWTSRVTELEKRLAPAILSFRAGVGYSSLQDTEIAAMTPTQGAPAADQIQIAGENSPVGEKQVLIRFDDIIGPNPGQIPTNAKIVSANLSFWAIDGASNQNPIIVHRMLANWDQSSATWDSFTNGVQADGYEAVINPFVETELGRIGYQITSEDLKTSIQSWLEGYPRTGWLLRAGDSTGAWTFASSDYADVSKRPCLSVEFTAPGYVNPSYKQLAGDPPLPTKLEWFDWNDDLRNRRLSRVPSERANTFYFAQNGDDLTGHGTIEQPWKSLAKAWQILSDSHGTGVRLRFRRGDVWRETTTITAWDYSGYTIDDYGNTTLAKPLFSRFMQLDSQGWVQVEANLYKLVNPPDIGWVRESADGFSRIYYRGETSAEVRNHPISWYYDSDGTDPNSGGTPTLYLNCGGNPSDVVGGFEACPGDGLGWLANGDNIRLENLRLEGQGIQANGFGYGLQILHQRDYPEFVGVGLEVYYTGYHSIGHIVQYQGSHGAATLVNCSAGLATNRVDSGGLTIFVAYGDFGGNEYIQYDCEARFGALPSSDWNTVAGQSFGLMFYCHIAGGGSLDLVILQKSRVMPCQNPLSGRNATDGLPVADELHEVRGFIVEETGGPVVSHIFRQNLAVINCVLDRTSPPPPFGFEETLYADYVYSAWVINSTVSIDASLQTGFTFLLMRAYLRNSVKLMNCQVDIFNCPTTLALENIQAPPSLFADAILSNSIFSLSGSSATSVGFINDSGHLRHNAYYLSNLMNPAYGYSGDNGAVTLSRRYPIGMRPSLGSLLYNGGIDVGLEYDQQRQPRGSVNTIGPLNGAPLPAPSSIQGVYGIYETAISPGTTLASPSVRRIRMTFPTDVDVGPNSLQLFNEAGPIALQLVSYDASQHKAEWLLDAPLAMGRYTIELDYQPLVAFNILPGDFNSNGVVDASDFAALRNAFGTTSVIGDLDGDGQCDADDFALFRQFFGLSLVP